MVGLGQNPGVFGKDRGQFGCNGHIGPTEWRQEVPSGEGVNSHLFEARFLDFPDSGCVCVCVSCSRSYAFGFLRGLCSLRLFAPCPPQAWAVNQRGAIGRQRRSRAPCGRPRDRATSDASGCHSIASGVARSAASHRGFLARPRVRGDSGVGQRPHAQLPGELDGQGLGVRVCLVRVAWALGGVGAASPGVCRGGSDRHFSGASTLHSPEISGSEIETTL